MSSLHKKRATFILLAAAVLLHAVQKCFPTMGPAQLLPPSKLSAAQSSIQAGGDGVRDGVAMMLEAISEYNDMQSCDGVTGSQVWRKKIRYLVCI